jgi:tetratricopeptide (TPR) repeat protein
MVCIFPVVAGLPSLRAADTNTMPGSTLRTPAEFAARARDLYEKAREHYGANTNDPAAATDFARACFDWADLVKTSHERAAIAEEGIATCQQVIASDPKSARGHYYLAMDYGQLARTKSLGALKLVVKMEAEFQSVLALDEKMDYAGAHRGLGMLYRDAPSFGSLGNRTKAREHLQKALDLSPDYPENRLNLVEAYVSWGDRDGARTELAALEKLWPIAQTNLKGDAWAVSWWNWEVRLKAVKQKFGKMSRP